MNFVSGKERNRLDLGRTIPFLLAASFIAEVGLRAVPIELFAFRSTEVLQVAHVPGLSAGPFLPSKRYRNDRTYGDLAGFANLRRLRQYRREIFTTDAFGYRNPKAPPTASPPVAMLLGDSFGVGAGTEDSETLPAHLGRLWKRDVYNASGMTPPADLKRIRRLARELGMRDGLVLYEYLERQELPAIPRPESSRPSGKSLARPKDISVTGNSPFAWNLSRLRILANRMYRFFQDDRLLPNPYAANASVRRLTNGREVLFLPGELDGNDAARPVNAAYWAWLGRQLRGEGFQLVVLLVPNKSTIYGPLLAGRRAENGGAFDYLDRLERALSATGVSVVNLEKVFRARAARELAKESYLYWLDDTHWNGKGMRVAAEEIDRVLREKGVSHGLGY